MSTVRSHGFWLGLAPLAALLGLSLLAGPVSAEKIGVAAAVNPDAFSSLNGGQRSEISIGKSIFYNERINTTGSGLVQVLLIDGSTFTVGPGSDLVIDKFVYDPKKKQGEVVATFSKGVLRFVGGKLSKNEGGVTVKTPAGVLAIRGGIFQGSLSGNSGIFSFLYGEELTFTGNNGKRYTVYQPGYTLDLTGGVPNIRPTTSADTQLFMAALTNGNTNGSGDGNQNNDNQSPTFQQADTQNIDQLIKDANTVVVQTEILNELNNNNNEPPPPTDTANDPPPPDGGDPPPPEPPQQVTVRVLSTPGVYTAFPNSAFEFTTENGGEAGILGGGNYPEGTADPLTDDFQWTFDVVDGRIVGTITGLIDAQCIDVECSGLSINVVDPVEVDFPFFSPDETSTACQAGLCFVTDATITQLGVVTNHVGTAVAKPGFFAYQLVPGESTPEGLAFTGDVDPLLVFGGQTYTFDAPSGELHLFQLTADINNLGAVGPFASSGSSPAIAPGAASVSPLMVLENDSDANSRAVWLQTSFYIGGDGSDQESFINVALGGTQDGGLVGARRGGSAVDFDTCDDACIEREAFAFTGDIASLSGPDGSHFLGSDNPNIVIGFDSTGSHNIGRDIPLDPDSLPVEDQSGSTYHIGIGTGSIQPAAQTLSGPYRGYAAGMVESDVPTGFTNVVASTSPDDLTLFFDPVTNTLQASITVHDVQNGDNFTDAYIFAFGDSPQDPQNRSAYIDDQHYAAIESTSGTAVVHQENQNQQVLYQNASASSYFVSGEQINVTAFFPETFGEPDNGIGQPFCTDCAFLQWGAWGSRVGFNNGETSSQFVDNIHLAWWVAGDIATGTDLDNLQALGASATYQGHVIGSVANNLDEGGWKTYVATGDLAMSWSFASRTGELAISNFDGRGYGTGPGGLTQPSLNINHFGGSLSQNAGPIISGITGRAAGSFVRGPLSPAQGVIGNWNVGSSAYKATGIFGGSGTPQIPVN